MGDGVRKIVEGDRGNQPPAVGKLPQQQPQKGGLTPAVPANEAQLPMVVDLKGGVVKHQVRAAGIGKGKTFRLNHRHMRHLLAVGPV